jgi:TP901 family phage tail tape measure protein
VADFRIVVRVDPSGVARGTRQVEQNLNRVGNAADRTRQLISRTFALVGIGGAISGSIRLIANFEQSISSVGAVSGATGQQLLQLREEAQRLGSTTRFSASEAAEGLLFLSRAGFSVDESLQTIQGTLQLAQAGALDLASAADIASNILSGFRLEAEEAGRVVDVIALAANSANTNVFQLGEALKFVAPVAAGLGVSIEETSAAIGVLSDAGLQASLAGTGLRRVLSELESPASRTEQILKSVGLTAEEVQVSQVGLTEAIRALAEAGVDTALALEIFGDRGGPAFEVLSNGIPRVEELTTSLNDAEGAAARIAEIMDDNLNGALLSVRSAFEGLILELGDSGATGAFQNFFEAVAGGLRFLTDNVENFINALETLSIVLGVQYARRAIPRAIAATRAFSVAIASNPIGALATVITVAIAALISFSDQLELTTGSTASALDFIIVAFERFSSGVLAAINFIIGLFGDFQITLDNFDFLEFIDGAAVGLDGVLALFEGAFSGILAIFDDFPRLLGEVFIDTFNFIIRGTESFVNAIVGALNEIPGVSIATLDGVIPQLENPFEGAAANVGRAAQEGFVRGFQRSIAQDLVGDIAVEAERRASERASLIEDAFGASTAGAATPGVPGTTLTETRPSFTPGEADRNAILERELELFEQEAEILGVVGLERQKLQAILATEEQIRNDLRQSNEDLTEEQLNNLATLSASERERIAALVEQNDTLQRQASILEDIQAPVEEYSQTLAALNALLDQGAISQAEFNEQLRQTGLAASLIDLDQQLFGPFGEGLAAQTQLIRDQQAEQLQIVQQALEARIISEEEAAERIRQINTQTAAAISEANLSGYSLILGNAQNTFGMIADVARNSAGEQSDAFKALFAVSQGFALANAIVQTASGVANALGSAPPPISFINAALVAAAGAAQVATIVGQTLALRDGGFVAGPGTSRSDSIPAMLSNGEFVVNARATRQNRALLEAMNSGANVDGGSGVTVVQNISTPDADSFRRSDNQINARLQQELARSRKRNTNG